MAFGILEMNALCGCCSWEYIEEAKISLNQEIADHKENTLEVVTDKFELSLSWWSVLN